MKTKYLALASFCSVNAFAWAQNTPNHPANSFEKISVMGSRTPIPMQSVAGSLSLIDKAQITASGALSLSDLLRTIPSVNISSSGPRGALTEIRFRGSESNHVLVMIDGVEVSDLAQGGVIDLSHILLANIERIEILKGPQSALWGSAAIAGVINVTTNQAGNETANVSASVGNKDSYQLQASYSSQASARAYDTFKYSISASHFDTQGENIARSGNEADGYKNSTMYARFTYDFSSESRISANIRAVDYQNDFDTTDGNSGFIADANNFTEGRQLSGAFNWYFAPESSIWSQSLSLQYTEQENKNLTENIFSGASKGQKLRTVYNHQFQIKRGHINLGIEAVDEKFAQSGPIGFGDPNQKQGNHSQSLIADTVQNLGAKISLNMSARYDYNDVFENAGSYRIGLNYEFSPAFSGFMSTGKAIKNPSFTERFGFFPGTFLGNPEIEPESSRTQEIGFRAQLQDYDISASWYRSELEEEILGFIFEPTSGLFTAQNAELNSTREGLEFEVLRTKNKWQWLLSYAYLDASELDARELRRAKHSGSAWVSYAFTENHNGYLQLDYTGEKFDRFFPPFPAQSQVLPLDSYWLVSANYSYRHSKSWKFSIRLSNAFNQAYEDLIGFSGESRRILTSINYVF